MVSLTSHHRELPLILEARCEFPYAKMPGRQPYGGRAVGGMLGPSWLVAAILVTSQSLSSKIALLIS